MTIIQMASYIDVRDELNQDLGLAWAAGFMDGEGCICIYKQQYWSSDGNRKTTHRLRVTIGQNNYEVLDRFKDAVGVHGKIFNVKRTVSVNKQVYALNYEGLHAYELLIKLRPYLIRKRYEADAIKEFWREGKMNERTGRKPVRPEVLKIRESWYRKLRRMK